MENDASEIFTEQPVAYGTFGERVAAALIDGMLLAAVFWIVDHLFGNSVRHSGFKGGSWYIHYYSSRNGMLNALINWLYFAIQESGPFQATVGKRAMRLQVTSLSGHRISFLNATGRHFGRYLSTIILMIGYLMVLWDDRKQTLHDKMAGTMVIKKAVAIL